MKSNSAALLQRFRREPVRVTWRAWCTGLAALALLPLSATAQTTTSAVPGLFNFQGKVANANGTLVGASPNPVNRTVVFRIWDHASNSTAANLVYSEHQVVTITDGEFSVLIGSGSAVTTTPLGYNESAKGPSTVTIGSAGVFAGATRFLGITIDDNNSGTTDPEVTPRQQLVTSAYAFRAKYAESLGSNGVTTLTVLDSGNVGIGTSTPLATLDVNGGAMIRGALTNASSRPTVGAGRLSAEINGYSSTSPFQNDGFLRLSAGGGTDANTKSFIDLSGYSTAADMDRNLVFGTGGAERMRINNNGALMIRGSLSNVTTRPAVGSSRLAAEIHGYSAAGDALDDGFLRLSAGGGTSAGTKSFIDLTGYSTAADMNSNLVFGTGGAERVRITSSGNVGIGTNIPGVAGGPWAKGRLNVDGNIRLSGETGGGSWSDQRLLFGGDGTGHPLTFASVNNAGGISAPIMTMLDNGNVGIGVSTPGSAGGSWARSRLAVNGNIALRGDGTGAHSWINQRLLFGGDASGYLLQFASVNNIGTINPTIMTLSDLGRVGIGTTNPARGKLEVVGTGNGQSFSYGYLNVNSTGVSSTTNTGYSIWTDGRIAGAEFNAHSDERIKVLMGRSDGASDLAKLLQIEVTDYRFKDTIAHKDTPQKKVVAQQVEKVYPQAVSMSTNSVPDIFALAKVSGDWMELATDLKVGDRVQLITDNNSRVHEVVEVAAGRFRTTLTPKGEKVFVYGREVKDFRAVDYDAIAMLNVSATQELKREKDAEIADLKKRVAELESKDRARDAKLAAIEKLLSSSSAVMALPAKPATANGQE